MKCQYRVGDPEKEENTTRMAKVGTCGCLGASSPDSREAMGRDSDKGATTKVITFNGEEVDPEMYSDFFSIVLW